MLHLSKDWKRNKWWLFDRVVESPHRTAFFVRGNLSETSDGSDPAAAAQWWYAHTSAAEAIRGDNMSDPSTGTMGVRRKLLRRFQLLWRKLARSLNAS